MSFITRLFRDKSRSAAVDFARTPEYETIAGGDFSDDKHSESQSDSPTKPRRSPLLVPIYALTFVAWSILVFKIGAQFPEPKVCNRKTTTWSPAQDMIRFNDVKIKGDFFQPSPYRGAGDDIDAAWDEIWMIGGVPIRIEESRLEILQKDPNRNWTRVPESRGGGIAGYPEVFHQLHCLNLLRMATYPQHYANHTLFVDHPPRIVRNHIDHCVEIIRIHLQCTAEMTPVLTEMLAGHKLPSADFNVVHKCRNFDELKTWTEKNVLHGVGAWDIPKHDH